MSQRNIRLRVYNIPSEKTQSHLSQEFNSVVECCVELIMKTDTEHAGYAFVYFQDEEKMSSLVSHLNKLRHDLVIYKEIQM